MLYASISMRAWPSGGFTSGIFDEQHVAILKATLFAICGCDIHAACNASSMSNRLQVLLVTWRFVHTSGLSRHARTSLRSC